MQEGKSCIQEGEILHSRKGIPMGPWDQWDHGTRGHGTGTMAPCDHMGPGTMGPGDDGTRDLGTRDWGYGTMYRVILGAQIFSVPNQAARDTLQQGGEGVIGG